MTSTPTLREQWADLAQAITLAAEDEHAHPAGPLVDRMMALATAERMAVCVDAQLRAIEWVARELGGELGNVVRRLGELVARGDQKP